MDSQDKKSDELKKAIQKDIESSDDALKAIKALSDIAPDIENRKKELGVLLDTVKKMPDEIAEEIAPRLLIVHRDGYEQFQAKMPKIFQFDYSNLSVNSTSGTASIYHAEISSLYKSHPTETWAKDSIASFDQLATEKATKSSLLINLGKLDANLPHLFSALVDSYEKSKSGIVGLDNAAIRIRDLIQQLWGTLVSKTKLKCGAQIGNNRLELNKLSHREKVARCISNRDNYNELLIVLNQLSQLHLDLSKPGKDPMFSDRDLLNDFYTRAILQIDALFAWIDLSIASL